jgi:hypothetical protein
VINTIVLTPAGRLLLREGEAEVDFACRLWIMVEQYRSPIYE